MTPVTTSVASPPIGGGLCDQFVVGLFVGGASLSVFDSAGHQSTICASDGIAARADSLQFELGEGPRWDALASGDPVLCPDLRGGQSRWPLFGDAVRALGIAAVFAFPMKIGAAVVGVVDLYSLTPRRLDPHQVSLASSMANRSAVAAVRLATITANDPVSSESERAPAVRREVHQATGMIQAQLDTTATDALVRLRARAFATSTPIDSLARDAVAGRIDFSALPD